MSELDRLLDKFLSVRTPCMTCRLWEPDGKPVDTDSVGLCHTWNDYTKAQEFCSRHEHKELKR